MGKRTLAPSCYVFTDNRHVQHASLSHGPMPQVPCSVLLGTIIPFHRPVQSLHMTLPSTPPLDPFRWHLDLISYPIRCYSIAEHDVIGRGGIHPLYDIIRKSRQSIEDIIPSHHHPTRLRSR